MSLAIFLRVHSNSKGVSYLYWQNRYPNLKTTCHIKLKVFLWTKLLESLPLEKYLISVAATLSIFSKKKKKKEREKLHHICLSERVQSCNLAEYKHISACLDSFSLVLNNDTSAMQGRRIFQPIFKLLKWHHFRSLTVTSYAQSSCYPAEHSSVGFKDYADGYSKFSLKKPKHFNFAKEVLEEWANKEKVSSCR